MGSNVTMTADTPGRRRPGGQPKPKDQKRIAVNLRMSPALHARLVAMAKEHGRSITQQAEMLLDQAMVGALRADEVLEGFDRIDKQLAEMRNRLDEQRAELLKQHDEQEAEALKLSDEQRAELLKQRNEQEAEALKQRDELRKQLNERKAKARNTIRELAEREARAGKRKP
jgi:hypothetical protein